MKIVTIETKTDFGRGETFNEVFDVYVQNPKDKEEIISAIKIIIDDFNKEELDRVKRVPDYPPAPERKFVELVSIVSVLEPIKWTKLTGYHNNQPIWCDDNTGYVELSEFKPKRKKLKNFFCKTCNRDFDSKNDFEHHKNLESHKYCENSLKTYPFWSLKFEELREEEYKNGL